MSMPQVQVGRVMTKQVHTIRAGESVKTAKEFMSKYGIRHLPVLDGGRLVGVVSDRDFSLATEIKGSEIEGISVEDICSSNTYETRANSDLKQVSMEMAEKKYGSAVVVDSTGKVEGILTTTDICRVLAQILAGEIESLQA